MARRLLATFLRTPRSSPFLTIVALVALTGCSKKPELRELSPEGTALVVQMPRPIKHQSKQATIADEFVTAHAYTASFDDVIYVVNYQPIPAAAREAMRRFPIDTALDSAQAQLVRSTGATVMKQTGAELRTSTGGFLGREVSLALADGKHKMVARMFPAGDIFVQVAVTLPLQRSYNQELYAMRFLESARLR